VITSKIIQNFDFGKLRNKIDDIIDDVVDEAGESASMHMINKIVKGVRPKLAASTLRKDKNFPRLSKKPLLRTGTLLKSLEYDKDTNSIEMKHYGKNQNDGFWNGHIKVPARPFIEPSLKNVKKDLKVELTNKIKRAIKK
jgi:hypothetical protein